MYNKCQQPFCEVPEAALDRLTELISRQIGLQLPNSRRKDLLRGTIALAQEEGTDIDTLLHTLNDEPLSAHQIRVLSEHLTIGETYFFRERKSLNAFKNHILPEVMRRRTKAGIQRIKIWSAGCSTGEEAYTIAIILDELLSGSSAWHIDILATDLNPQSLKKAQSGIYTKWSFRGMPNPIRERYFSPLDNKAFAIDPRIKKMVT
ncbi:CheR family methyltransferase [Verrucomicrobiota bacterium]